MSADSDDDISADLIILTPQEMLVEGLQVLGWDKGNMTARLSNQTKIDRFRAHFGADPHVIARIWEDLQTTTNENAIVEPSKRILKHFFMALHFLKKYPQRIEANTTWKISENNYKQWVDFFVGKVRAMKDQKLGWPDDNFGDDIWIGTVDGTHFVSQEIAGKEFPTDPSIFSFKHHTAGFNYEIVVALRESKIVWFNGPFPAGDYNDIRIFAEKGLKDKLLSTGKKVIADKGYSGYPKLISLPNSFDKEEVSRFKSRARLRQEKLNGKLKNFECLDSGRFRHTPEKLQACFEAVAVIVQYKMEMGEPLYDV